MIAKLKAVERDKQALEGRKLEAEAYLGKQAERLRLRLAGNMAHARRHEVGLAEVESKADEFRARLEHERAKYKAFDQELKAADDALAAADACASDKQTALEKAQAAFKAFERRDAELRMVLKHAREKQKKAQLKAEQDAAQAAQLEADVARLEGEEIPAAAALAEKLQRDLAEAEATVEKLAAAVHGEVEKLRAQLGAVKAELSPWEQQMREAQARVDVATSERDLVLREQGEAKLRLEQARAALEAARAEAHSKEQEIVALRQELESARADEQFARKAAEDAAAQEQELEQGLRSLRARAASLRQDASSATTANAAMAALLDAKRKGAIPGLHGRLGDLGAIDPRLDAAISTSCPQLDHIVVDTMVDAQKGVELLRKGQLGVRSFLILERQRHFVPRLTSGPPAALPSGCVRLFDAVKPANDAARLAFYSVLRDSVVTETTQQARDLVFARDTPFRRAVTLSGAVVEAGGTLTGGGQPRRGRMRVGDKAPSGAAAAADAKAQAAELAQAERELAQGDERLRQARDEREAGLKAATACAKRAAQLEVALPKAAAVVDAKKDEARDLEGRLADLERQAVARPEDEQRAKELAKQLSDEAINLAKLRASSQGLSRRAAELQAKIDQAGGEPLRKARASVGTLTKKIADAEGDGAAKTAQAKAAAKQLARLKKEQQASGGGGGGKAAAAKLDKEVSAALDALKEIEPEALSAMESVERLGVEVGEAEAAAGVARKAREAKSAEVGVIRSVEAEVEAALSKLGAAQREHAAEAKRLGREVEADAEALGEYLPRLAAIEEAAAAEEEEQGEEEEGMDVDGEQQQQGGEGGEGGGGKTTKKKSKAAAAAAAPAAAGLPAGTTYDARGVPVLSPEQLDSLSTDDLFYRVAVLDEQLRAMSPDLDAIEAFADKAKDFAAKAAELQGATSERDAARRAHDALRKARLDGFMEGFNAISLKLKEMYQMITLGGDAELELVDTLDPFSEVRERQERGWGGDEGGGGGGAVQESRPNPARGKRKKTPPRPPSQNTTPRKLPPPTPNPPHTNPRPPQTTTGHCLLRAPPQKVVEAHRQPVGRRKDALEPLAGLCPSPLQADAALRDGRDRRGARLQERVHRYVVGCLGLGEKRARVHLFFVSRPAPTVVFSHLPALPHQKKQTTVGHYIKERTKNAQFVIISLRNNMFELADRLVGIYKTDNATKTVAINPGEFCVGAAAAAAAQTAAAGKAGAAAAAPAADGDGRENQRPARRTVAAA
jgi:structural maintenance of chromosome 4